MTTKKSLRTNEIFEVLVGTSDAYNAFTMIRPYFSADACMEIYLTEDVCSVVQV